ncbi:methyl-accepting chemotaxis protein [Halomicrococcus gelatinilyticus]|uniref:methyl-accepting chemotaxis protein n=1 Tax=Halomicrococcus gelatinilyticus TaxID=1702103 RepID=UPI002E11DF48
MTSHGEGRAPADADDRDGREATTDGGRARERVVDPEELRATTDGRLPTEVATAHADHLTDVVRAGEPGGSPSPLARRSDEAGVGADQFVGTYGAAFDALVSSVFEGLDGGDDLATAERRLREGARALVADARTGVAACVDGPEAGGSRGGVGSATAGDVDLRVEEVLGALPMPAFVIDADHTVLAYNYGVCELLGIEPNAALGKDNRETIAAASYTDGRRHRSLVDKVADAPRTADEEFDVERVDMPFSDRTVYEDTATLLNRRDEEIHAGFWAIPLFDADDDLRAVLEVVDDRTDEQRHKESVAALVEEVTGTLQAVGDGDLAARAEYADEHGVIDEELLTLTDEVNAMAKNFQTLVERVESQADSLATSIGEASASASRIDDQVDEQNESLATVAEEMESFSAGMEQVAASANEVTTAADDALAAVERGLDAGEAAGDAAGELRETSEETLTSVAELESHVDEIGEVVEVIASVAEQTNILALNANIEAARTDSSGDGFAVVAEEVKELATQTQRHTEEIADRIEALQERASDTVESVETSHEQARCVDEEVTAALDSMREVSDAVETAATGIAEVAEANDEQAATVQSVTATLDSVEESAGEVDATVDDIVREMDAGAAAVTDLSERVGELTDGD